VDFDAAGVVWAPVPLTATSIAQGRRARSVVMRWITSANSFTSLLAADLLSTDTN
jgi:hypothetical protein